MKKEKPVLGLGDTVKLRGREPMGLIRSITGPDKKWVGVAWQTEITGPEIVHMDELEHVGIPRHEL